MNHFQGNIFQELKEKKVLDKDGKVDALGAYGKMKLTGQEIAAYFKKNKVKDAQVKKAVGVALDLSGADSIARKEIAKYYGNAILKNKDVQKALQYANESYISNQEVESLDESLLIEKNLMPEIQKIVSDKSASKVGGVMLDMFTASMISKVYDKVNDGNKKKMESANITVLVKLAHKVMGMKEDVSTAIFGSMLLALAPFYVMAGKAMADDLKQLKTKSAKKGFKPSKEDQSLLQKFVAIVKRKDPEAVKKAEKKANESVELEEGKYTKYSDLLVQKARLVAQGPIATKEVLAINKKIAAEMKKLGVKESIFEAKSSTGYDLYHKTFSGAMQHAYTYSKKKFGIEIDPKEIDDKVAMGPKRPSSGKTNSYRLKGKDGKKGIQVQVANLDNKRYELNMYKEETSNMDRYASAIRES